MTEYYFVFVLKESLFLNFKRKNNKKCVTHTHRYMRFKELLCIKNAYKKIRYCMNKYIKIHKNVIF